MAPAALSAADVTKLLQFHSAHFPGQKVPLVQHSSATPSTPIDAASNDTSDGLGYYDDGVKRTLTDDQIAMFRNSEIQRQLQEKRRTKEIEGERDRSKRKVDGDIDNVERERIQARHSDEPAEVVDTLMYDDEPSAQPSLAKTSTTFLWPKLG